MHTTPTPTPPAAKRNIRTTVLLVALTGALAWNVLQIGAGTESEALAAPPLTLPELRCGVGSPDPEELTARSTQLAAAARAGIERYPFRPAEGLSALAGLVEASACSAQAGADADAAILGAQARRFFRRLEADHRDRLLRVERALADDQPRRARADIETLATQLEGDDGPFAQRLRNLRAALADGEPR